MVQHYIPVESLPMDVSPAAHQSLIAMIIILQAVQIVQVPHDGCLLAVDLQRVKGLVAAGIDMIGRRLHPILCTRMRRSAPPSTAAIIGVST